jgi:hypothetical protein
MALFTDLPKAKPEYEKLILDTAYFLFYTLDVARREGLLSLEEYFAPPEDFAKSISKKDLPLSPQSKKIIKVLFEFVINGLESDEIADIAYYSIVSSKEISENDAEKLAMMMIAEGTLEIQKGANPRVLCSKLASMIGDDFGSKLTSLYEEWNDSWHKPSSACEEPKIAYDMSCVSDIVWHGDNLIKKIVSENRELLVKVLAFEDNEVKQKVYRNVSQEEKERLEKEIAEIEKPLLDEKEKFVAAVRKSLLDAGYQFESYDEFFNQ